MLLLALLNIAPAERLRTLQEDREELSLLLVVAVGLLIFAFFLLIVVIFRRQKSKIQELNVADLSAPIGHLMEEDAPVARSDTYNPGNQEPNVSEKAETLISEEASSFEDFSVEHSAKIELEVAGEEEELPSEAEVEILQNEPETLPREDFEGVPSEEPFLEPSGDSEPKATEPALQEPVLHPQSETLSEMPLAGQLPEAIQEGLTQEVLPVAIQPAFEISEQSQAEVIQQTTEIEVFAEEPPRAEQPEESSAELAEESEIMPPNLLIEDEVPELEEATELELAKEDTKSQVEKGESSVQESPSEPKTLKNKDFERVSKQIETVLEGAKSAEENRRLIAEYLQELEQRKSVAVNPAQKNEPVKETEQKSQAEELAVPKETVQASTDPVAPMPALLSGPIPEQDFETESMESSSAVQTTLEPEAGGPSIEMEVQPLENQEESNAGSTIPAAPGDFKSFTDWLKEYRKR